MNYITRDILQGKLKELQYYPVTCMYAPKGSGKTSQIKALFSAGHKKRKWVDLMRYPAQNKRKMTELREICHTIVKQDVLILDHYNDSYHTVLKEVNKGISVLLITDHIPKRLNKNWKYIDFHDICLSRDELYHICELNEIEITQQNLYRVYQATFGWFPAAEVYLEYYRHHKEYMEIELLDSVISDITKLMTHKLIKILPILSLCNSFSMELCRYMGADKHTLKELDTLAAHGWMIHKVKDQKQYELAGALRNHFYRELCYSAADLQSLHMQFAVWYEQHHDMMEALFHYDQAMSYDEIIRILENPHSVVFVDISTDLIAEIYHNLPVKKLRESPYAYLRVINDTLTSLNVTKGLAMLKDFEKLIPDYPKIADLLQGELFLMQGYLCINNIYEMNAYFMKAHACFHGETSKISSIGMNVTLGSPHTMYIYHRTPGDFEHLVSYLEDELYYYMDITNNLNAGFIQQARAELFMEQGNLTQAVQQAWEAFYIAKTYQQDAIMICSLFTIARCANTQRDEEQLTLILEDLSALLENNKNVYQKYALHSSLGYIYALRKDFSKASYHITQLKGNTISDLNFFSYVVQGVVYLYGKEYEKLNAIAAILLNYYRHEPHVLGEIYAHIFKAVCFYKQAKQEEAKWHFRYAIEKSTPDFIRFPYCELYTQLIPLFQLFEQDPFVISVKSLYGRFHNGFEAYKRKLTKKEYEVAVLMAKGYARKEIAGMQHVSVETVNSHAKRIFHKLQISSRKDLELSLKDVF